MRKNHQSEIIGHEKLIPNAILLPEIVKLMDEGHTVTIRLRGFSMRPFLEDNRDKALLTKAINPKVGDPESFQAKVDKKEAHYALLPVWMLTTKWRDKTYLFAMNGQTGKFAGELPTDKALFWRNLGILTLILTLVLRFSGITRFLLGFF